MNFMKNKYSMLAASVLISISAIAQKDELKAAQKALKNDPAQTKTILTNAESVFANATDAEKAQFHFLKGSAMFDLANKNVQTEENLLEAAKAFKEVMAIEKNGKAKYTADAQIKFNEIKQLIFNAAIKDNENEKPADASLKFESIYKLDNSETTYLYYASQLATSAQEYERALEIYKELNKIGYTGEGTKYFATNLANDQEQEFATLAERNQYVKLKTHTNPRDEKVPSKRAEILKNMALINVQLGKVDEAKKAIEDAKSENPGDLVLLAVEANLFAELNDKAGFEKVLKSILDENPQDSNLFNDLGLTSAKFKEFGKAEEFYKKAIALDSENKFPYVNLAVLYIDQAADMLDEMNSLGTSAAENKKYDQLKVDRIKAYEKALPNLLKFAEFEPKNEGVQNTINDIKRILE